MGFDDDPPLGLAVSPSPEAVTIQVRPLLPSAALGWAGQLLLPVGVALIGVGLVPYESSVALAVAGVALTFGGLGLQLWSDVRDRTRIELRLGRDDLRVRVLLGRRTMQETRVFLRDVARVGQVLARGRRRAKVRVRAGGACLDIPMDPHSEDAASWLASELARAGRRAVARDGGRGEVPAELRRLQRRQRDVGQGA